MKFCPKCGKSIGYKYFELEGNIPYCETCDEYYFPHNPACILALIEINDKLLIIKQDYLGDKYCLVAGHIKDKANAETTLCEEIKEEVNLDVISYEYLGSYYHEKSGNLMLGFYAKCCGDVALNYEVSAYKLVNKEEAQVLLKDSSAAYYILDLAIKKGVI